MSVCIFKFPDSELQEIDLFGRPSHLAAYRGHSMRIYKLFIGLAAFLVTAFTIITQLSVGSSSYALMSSLSGAFIGTLAGALIMLTMQMRMEQTRFFALMLDEVKTIFASDAAWECDDEGSWRRCEFRKAVGLAEWINDPKEDMKHLIVSRAELTQRGIDWPGVVYDIDAYFCVASKPLHDYVNWYVLLLDSLRAELMKMRHVKMLWRSLTDNLFIADPTDPTHSVGMRNWVELLVIGPHSAQRQSPNYMPHNRVMHMIEKYAPAARHVMNRRNMIEEKET